VFDEDENQKEKSNKEESIVKDDPTKRFLRKPISENEDDFGGFDDDENFTD